MADEWECRFGNVPTPGSTFMSMWMKMATPISWNTSTRPILTALKVDRILGALNALIPSGRDDTSTHDFFDGAVAFFDQE